MALYIQPPDDADMSLLGPSAYDLTESTASPRQDHAGLALEKPTASKRLPHFVHLHLRYHEARGEFIPADDELPVGTLGNETMP